LPGFLLALYWLYSGKNKMNHVAIGLGDSNAEIIFYIKNRPPLACYQNLTNVQPMVSNEITHICHETGNHWRKVFNVYAKLLFELAPEEFSTWQQLRDNRLLQADSQHCLLFSAPDISPQLSSEVSSEVSSVADKKRKLHIILAKGYSEQLGISNRCTWLSQDFAINAELGIIICPYFDYRQLSNKKITQLSGLISQLVK
tara:strand:+ start:25443 stop:26042 length:600 start_codon:yes stop_codon:yes gene_type:complete